MKKIFAEAIVPGDIIDDEFALAEKTVLQKKDGNAYLNVVLADRTGRIQGVVWDDVPAIAAALRVSHWTGWLVAMVVVATRQHALLMLFHDAVQTFLKLGHKSWLSWLALDLGDLYLELGEPVRADDRFGDLTAVEGVPSACGDLRQGPRQGRVGEDLALLRRFAVR